MRIASLLPSLTEWVWFFGLGHQLVARSHECDWPVETSHIPVCTKSLLCGSLSAQEIDAEVRQRLQAGLSLYAVDWALLRELQPDIILTQAQCAVCAVDDALVRQEMKTHLGYEPRVFSAQGSSLGEVYQDARQLAGMLDAPQEAHAQLESWHQSLLPDPAVLPTHPPTRALLLDWLEPPMLAGHWLPELLQAAGTSPLGVLPGERSRYTDWQEIAGLQPDVLFCVPCGMTAHDAEQATARLLHDTPLASLDCPVFACDGSAYFHRPGPRLLDSLALVREMLGVQASVSTRPEAWRKLRTQRRTSGRSC